MSITVIRPTSGPPTGATTGEYLRGVTGGPPIWSPYITNDPSKNQWIDTLPLQHTWTDPGYDDIFGSDVLVSQFQLIKQDGIYYIFFEVQGEFVAGTAFRIDVLYSTTLAGPWTRVESILTASPTPGDPDYFYVADPSVLYISWAEHKWHMWHDQAETAALGGQETTIGHAYADNPLGPWTKQSTGGVADIVIDIGTATVFDGYDDLTAHSPECFIYGGVVHCIYSAKGTGHTSWDAVLAIADDSQGLGHHFEKWGPVTLDNTLASGDAGRLKCIFAYQNVLYTVIDAVTPPASRGWISSYDGGRTWMQIGTASYPFAAFLVEGSRIWGVTQRSNANPFPVRLYYLDLDNLTGDVAMGDLVIGSRTNLPYVANVYRGFYVQGDTNFYRSAAGIWRTSGSLIVDGDVGIGATVPATALEIEQLSTIDGAVADGYAAAITLDPGYTAATAQTVARHNYIDIHDPSVTGAGPAAVTNAAVLRFDANIGTHKAVVAPFDTTDSGADTTTWAGGILVNVNGTLYKIPIIAV